MQSSRLSQRNRFGRWDLIAIHSGRQMPRVVDHVRLPGSFRPRPRVPEIGSAPPQELVRVSVVVRAPDDGLASLVARMGQVPPRARQYLSRQDFRTRLAARPEDLEKVRLFARNYGLRVLHAHPARRTVELSGTVQAMKAAFGIELRCYRAADHVFRGRAGWIRVPSWLAPSLEGVFGLDTRHQVVPHVRIGESHPRGRSLSASPGSRTPIEVAKLYNFPTSGRGSGQCIGLLEFGGGYRRRELQQYFSSLGIKMPRIIDVSVDGATNRPTGDPAADDGQVALDVQTAGAVAPEAKLVLYFAPNTAKGFVDAITTAVHDTVHRPSVISIGWGRPETAWTSQACRTVDRALREAAALGIPVVVASGSSGATGGARNDRAIADFPAASSYALACGGTSLPVGADTAAEEVAWNRGVDGTTGGGLSRIFPVPDYQARINPASAERSQPAGRGVPDICGFADQAGGYWSLVDGQSLTLGGTGAVAPLYAGLAALIQEQLRTGLAPLHRLLYSRSSSNAFHDIIRGDNDRFTAGPGWDACTGLGRLDGAGLLAALSGTKPVRPAADGQASPPAPARRKDIRLVLTILARDEVDIIETTIDYHLAQGVDAVIATDNRSRDGTRQVLERYAHSGQVMLIREEGEDYRQGDWVTRMARIAATELAADWVINADADEFWWPATGDLRATLRRIPPEYVTVLARRRNFVPVEPVDERPFFARMTLADPDPRTSHGAPLLPKVCHRGRPDITVVRGNHEVLGGDVGLPFDDRVLTVLHYPIRSYEQFEHKVVIGATSLGRRTLAGGVASSLGHLFEAYEQGHLRDYYNANVVRRQEAKAAVATGTLVADRRLVSFLRAAGMWTPASGLPSGKGDP